jgi:hypothetical protein
LLTRLKTLSEHTSERKKYLAIIYFKKWYITEHKRFARTCHKVVHMERREEQKTRQLEISYLVDVLS